MTCIFSLIKRNIKSYLLSLILIQNALKNTRVNLLKYGMTGKEHNICMMFYSTLKVHNLCKEVAPKASTVSRIIPSK
jgi:hypothetical protein